MSNDATLETAIGPFKPAHASLHIAAENILLIVDQNNIARVFSYADALDRIVFIKHALFLIKDHVGPNGSYNIITTDRTLRLKFTHYVNSMPHLQAAYDIHRHPYDRVANYTHHSFDNADIMAGWSHPTQQR